MMRVRNDEKWGKWTTKQVEVLKELYPTTNNEIISEKIGKTVSQIRHKAYQEGIKKGMQVQYVVYRYGIVIASGTARECAEQLDVQEAYIRWLVTPTAKKIYHQRKNPYKAISAVRMEDWEDEQKRISASTRAL